MICGYTVQAKLIRISFDKLNGWLFPPLPSPPPPSSGVSNVGVLRPPPSAHPHSAPTEAPPATVSNALCYLSSTPRGLGTYITKSCRYSSRVQRLRVMVHPLGRKIVISKKLIESSPSSSHGGLWQRWWRCWWRSWRRRRRWWCTQRLLGNMNA